MFDHIFGRIRAWAKDHRDRSLSIGIMLVVFSVGVAALIWDYNGAYRKNVEEITRKTYGKGKKTEELRVEGKDRVLGEIPIEVTEQVYGEQEISQVLKQAVKKIDSLILAENISLDHVDRDLNLLTEIPGKPIDVTWKLDRYDVINIYGKLKEDKLVSEGTPVKLTAILTYREDVEKQVDDCKLTNVSFNLMKGDKVALIGDPLKTTLLLKLIANELQPDKGSIQLGQTIKVSYIPDDNSSYFEGTQSICDWLSQYTDIDDMAFIRGFLGRMLFSGEEPLKPVNVLSGGEKARCMLSKTMLEAGNLLLMDDPINHLDLESIQTLNNALIKYPGELIFVSHDHQFIQTIANRIIEITDDGIIDRRMSYDDYLAKEYGIEE